MNTKAKGSRNERKSMRLFEKLGYVCTKAGASLGVWDIIAIGKQGVILCQVKSNKWPSSVEMEAMQLFQIPPTGVTKQVHRWDDYARVPVVRTL